MFAPPEAFNYVGGFLGSENVKELKMESESSAVVKKSDIKVLNAFKHHKSPSCNLYVVIIAIGNDTFTGTIFSYSGRPSKKLIVDKYLENAKIWTKLSA